MIAKESEQQLEERNVETHVSEEKKRLVRDLAELMKKKTVMVVSIKGLPAKQYQEMKKSLRAKAKIKVAKKSLVDFALDHCGIKELHSLVPHVQDSTAILFSDEDAFEIAAFLSENKTPAKAKEGQEAPEDIVVEAGPTDLLPGPDISALSAVGLVPQVKDGKIHIVKDGVLVKKGEKISSQKVSILGKLDITPFEIGLEPVAAFDSETKKVYADIKIDKEGTLNELIEMYSRSLAFAVSIDYVNDSTLPFVLSKAVAHGNAIDSLIKEDVKEEKVEEKPVEEVKEEQTNETPEVNEKPEGEQ